MSSFCDISSAHTDLFEKDFPTNWGVELGASNDISNLTLTANRVDATTVATSVKVKHHAARLGGDVTTQLNSNGDAELEVALEEKLPKGLKIKLVSEFPKTRSGRIATEYNQDNFNFKFSVKHQLPEKKVEPVAEAPKVEGDKKAAAVTEAPKADAPKVEAPKVDTPKAEPNKTEQAEANKSKTEITACTLFTHKQFSAGGSADFTVGTGLTSASFGVRHKSDSAAVAARVHHKEKKLSADAGVLYHLQNGHGDIGAQVTYDFDKKDALIQVGFSRTLDDASWKAKIGSDSVAALSYTHNWNKYTKVTSAVEFNVKDPSKAKAGVQVKYSD